MVLFVDVSGENTHMVRTRPARLLLAALASVLLLPFEVCCEYMVVLLLLLLEEEDFLW